jgi:hypothetical protein
MASNALTLIFQDGVGNTTTGQDRLIVSVNAPGPSQGTPIIRSLLCQRPRRCSQRCFVNMVESVVHLTQSCVMMLDCKPRWLLASKTDQAVDGMPNDFEAAAAHLLPCNPAQKKRADHAGTKRGSAEISDVAGEEVNVSSFGTKKGTGSGGLPLRCHTQAEHKLLDRSQKAELCEWRHGADAKGGKEKGRCCSKNRQFNRSKAVASAAEKKVEEKMKAFEKERTDGDDTEACVMSIFKKHGIGKGVTAQISDAAADPTPGPASPPLKSILKRVKNTETGA